MLSVIVVLLEKSFIWVLLFWCLQHGCSLVTVPRTDQQVECDDVRDHQQWHVDNRVRIGGAQLSRHRRKAKLNGVVVIDDDVGCPHEIEGDDERPKQRTYPCGEKR